MTWALCLSCGEVKWGALCPCQKCGVASSGDTSLDIAFSDHHYSKRTLVQFGAVIAAINAVSDDDDVAGWAFIRYVSDNHPEILSADTPPEIQGEVERVLNAADLPPVQVIASSDAGADDDDDDDSEPDSDDDDEPQDDEPAVNADELPAEPRRLDNRNPIGVVLRWVAVLPAAIIGGLLARFIVVVLNRFTMAPYVDPDSFLGRLFVEYIGGAVLGGAAVYAAAYVAPRFKSQVSIVMAALVLLIGGFLLFPSMMVRDYWAIFSIVCMGGGGGVVAYGIATGEIQS